MRLTEATNTVTILINLDLNFHKPCLAMGTQQSDSDLGGSDAPSRLFVMGVRTFFPFFLQIYCLRSSKPKYSASTISYILIRLSFSSTHTHTHTHTQIYI